MNGPHHSHSAKCLIILQWWKSYLLPHVPPSISTQLRSKSKVSFLLPTQRYQHWNRDSNFREAEVPLGLLLTTLPSWSPNHTVLCSVWKKRERTGCWGLGGNGLKASDKCGASWALLTPCRSHPLGKPVCPLSRGRKEAVPPGGPPFHGGPSCPHKPCRLLLLPLSCFTYGLSGGQIRN